MAVPYEQADELDDLGNLLGAPCKDSLIRIGSVALEGTRMTPTEEAAYALDNKMDREQLSEEARAEYDRLLQERYFAATRSEPPPDRAPSPGWAAPQVPARSSPETRVRILEMFKRGNRKYALPFEKDRLAVASFLGGNWEEYGQI